MTPELQRELVLVAGPNGSGKTTVTDDYIRARFPVWPKLNADRVASILSLLEPASPPRDRSLEAAGLTDQTARCLSLLGQAFVLETVLSSHKYRPLVDAARRLGLIFRLVYVTTLDPAINVIRVHQRVQDGGHDVPRERIHQRWHRSMDNLPWFAERADRMLVLDNSSDRVAVLALRRRGGPLELRDAGHPAGERLRPLAGRPAAPTQPPIAP